MSNEKIEQRNRRLCYAMEFVRAIFLGSAIMNTYYTDNYHLSQTQVFLLQDCLNSSMMLSDIPLGHLADRFGVRRMIVIGSVVQLVQSIIFRFCTNFWEFAGAVIITGMYLSALSNSGSSLMTLSLNYIEDEQERSKRYNAFEAAVVRWRMLGVVASMVSGWAIIRYQGISMPFTLQPIVWIVALGIAAFLKKPAYELPTHVPKGKMRATVRLMLRDKPAVRYAIITYAAVWGTGFCFAWLTQPRLRVAGLSNSTFPLVYCMQYLCATGAITLITGLRGRKNVHDNQLWYGTLAGVTGTGVLVGLTTNAASAFLGMTASVVCVTTQGALIRSYLYEALPHDYSSRTAELSVMTTAITTFSLVLGPFAGLLTDNLSVSKAYIVVSCIGLCIGLPAFRAFIRHSR